LYVVVAPYARIEIRVWAEHHHHNLPGVAVYLSWGVARAYAPYAGSCCVVLFANRRKDSWVIRRDDILRELGDERIWDVLVIGGGATGLGTAVESASRGYRTLLIEKFDFAKGTSSRSTKLAHGGVRYLQQFNLTLVLDALRERGHMLRNAPHLVHDLSLVVPAYSYLSVPYYGLGLKVYERMSGRLSLGSSELLSRKSTLERIPGIHANGLCGGILYHDGQFDDARYAIALMRTLEDLGGTAINYVEATDLIERSGKVIGVNGRDRESDQSFELRAKVVINACGAQAEQLLALDGHRNSAMLAVSQGTHFVLPRSFLPGTTAVMIPKTADGRVLFAIPWHGATMIGTTDEPVDGSLDEPRAMQSEKQFLLDHICRYFDRRPKPEEILSMWSGLRPLVRRNGAKTSQLSRDHTVLVSPTGLITVTGGKWTTYRRMGQDAIDRACAVAGLAKAPSKTLEMKLHGWVNMSLPAAPTASASEWECVYGSDLPALKSLSKQDPRLDALLHPRLPFRKQEVIWAVRNEMARTVEDVLARRTRALFLDARAAIEAAPVVACLLAGELGKCDAWRDEQVLNFTRTAQGYLYED
jgi:glycerol-3-phosphate dehydrogenase